MLIIWVTPTDEELFKKYNPDLQKRALAHRQERQDNFDLFVDRLKDHSRSDKHIWEAAAESEMNAKETAAQEQQRVAAEIHKRRDEIRRQSAKH